MLVVLNAKDLTQDMVATPQTVLDFLLELDTKQLPNILMPMVNLQLKLQSPPLQRTKQLLP
jgi:hypothetical protein